LIFRQVEGGLIVMQGLKPSNGALKERNELRNRKLSSQSPQGSMQLIKVSPYDWRKENFRVPWNLINLHIECRGGRSRVSVGLLDLLTRWFWSDL